MIRYASLFLIPICLLGQIPGHDARKENSPNTDTHFAMPAYKTRAEWEKRRTHLRDQILFAAGLLPAPEKTPLNPLFYGRVQNEDYTIEKVSLETMPGYYLCGNLYRPRNKQGKLPAIASPHGHWTYGRVANDELVSVPGRAINLARQGYIVFAYDMVGYTDTVQTPHAFGSEREQLWSFGPLGLQLWNSIRVVDFLSSLPEVDTERIGATGASGGATQIILLAAVDDRVKFSAPVNMISAIMQGGSPCENAPGLRIGTSNLELGAMMAPRPLLMVSASGDWTHNTPKEEFPALRGIYELYGAANQIETIQIDAPHNYNKASRDAVYRFFGKHALQDGDASHFAERSFHPEKLQDILVWHGRTLPVNALRFEQIVTQWIAAASRQNSQTTDAREQRRRLSLALKAEWPEQIVEEKQGDKVLLSRPQRGDRVAVQSSGEGTPALIVVHPDGIESARRDTQAQTVLKNGEPALFVEAFQTGNSKAPRDQSTKHFLAFNKTDDAERVQDVLTAASYLIKGGAKNVRVLGIGDAAIWCLFAAALDSRLELVSPPSPEFKGSDEDFIKHFFVPGIQRAGGLKAALALARTGR